MIEGARWDYQMEKAVIHKPIDSLVPHPKNPNKHDKAQIDRLAELIKYQGWRHPIIVSELSGYVVAGHGRLLAAKQLNLKTVPVHYQSFENEEQEYAFLVSDNAIASWSELDLSSINTEVPGLGSDFDIDLLGIKDFTLEAPILPEPSISEDPSDKDFETMNCPNCGVIIEKQNG